jgi:glycosyltransferase involved in cell wall biosynthesis
LSEYDLVISSSGAEAKAVKARKDAVNICYMHAPTHYYWSRYDSYLKDPGFGKLDFLARFALKVLVGPLRALDKKFSARPDYIIANSNHTAREIKKYYGRESTVIFPPVGTERFKNENKRRSGFIVTGRQTPYKKIDLAVQACVELGLPITVVGNGPDHEKVVAIADGSSDVRFLTKASDAEVSAELSKARGFIFAGLDDFGIAPVEALASGTPVVAFQGGGALDYVIDGENGVFFEKQTVSELKKALKRFGDLKLDSKKVAKSAEKFSEEVFETEMKKFIGKVLDEKKD